MKTTAQQRLVGKILVELSELAYRYERDLEEDDEEDEQEDEHEWPVVVAEDNVTSVKTLIDAVKSGELGIDVPLVDTERC